MSRKKELDMLLDLPQHSRIDSGALECDIPAGCKALAGVSQCFLESASSKAMQVDKPQSSKLQESSQGSSVGKLAVFKPSGVCPET